MLIGSPFLLQSVRAAQMSTNHFQLHNAFKTNVNLSLCHTHTWQPGGVEIKVTLYSIKSGGNPIKTELKKKIRETPGK